MAFKNIETLENATYDELIAVDEIGDRIAQSVLKYFADERNVMMLSRLKSHGLTMSVSEDKFQKAGDALHGLTFVISGTFSFHSRDEYKNLIEQNGGKNVGSVSSKTSYILAGENMGPEKLKKAESLGVQLINETDFLKMIGAENPSKQEFTGTLF
jgi:DNA ligase (NAD+)